MMSDTVVELFGQTLVGRLVGIGFGKTENLLDFLGFKNVGAQQTVGQLILANQIRLEPGFAFAIGSLRGYRAGLV
jgi:hypothetical protein